LYVCVVCVFVLYVCVVCVCEYVCMCVCVCVCVCVLVRSKLGSSSLRTTQHITILYFIALIIHTFS
jgi:hypothetical protein